MAMGTAYSLRDLRRWAFDLEVCDVTLAKAIRGERIRGVVGARVQKWIAEHMPVKSE